MTEFLNSLSASEMLRVKQLKKTDPSMRKRLHRVKVNEVLKKKLEARPMVRFDQWSKKTVKPNSTKKVAKKK